MSDRIKAELQIEASFFSRSFIANELLRADLFNNNVGVTYKEDVGVVFKHV